MKRLISILALCALVIPAAAQGQPQAIYEDFEAEVGGRLSVEVDKKLCKGLHLSVSEEVRFGSNFSSFDRTNTGIDLSYKVCPYFKVGVGYVFMDLWRVKEDSRFWDMRHRAYLDLTGLYKVGGWHFSLRERVQLTHKTRDINNYQAPQNDLVLRSRFKVSYGFHQVPLEPYFAVEVRNTLNGVHFNAVSPLVEPGDNIVYNDVYINRIRFQLGTTWQIDARNSLDFYYLADLCNDKDFDATGENKKDPMKEGVLKSVTYSGVLKNAICVGYKFSF